MPDPRPVHNHVAHSVYGAHGPRNDMPGGSPRPMTTQLRFAKAPAEPPQSLAEHIEQAVARVPGLSPKQRQAVAAVMVEKTRDLHFIKLVMDMMPRAPQQDEGRVL
jgi:hypothetical protein